MFFKKSFKKGLSFVLAGVMALSMVAATSLPVSAATEKVYRPLPNEYKNISSKQGTIEKLSYKWGNDTKYFNVYLPNGYSQSDTSKKYNVVYLMHGGGEDENLLFGGPGQNKELKVIIDNMIAKGDIKPAIFVTPSFYKGNNDVAGFPEELSTTLIPYVETKYNTYLKSTSVADMKASRDHRAFGGFSMGSVCTWYTYINCLDYIKYFMPFSGDCWAIGGGNNKAVENAAYLANVAKKGGYKAPHDFKLFCASGSEDIAYPNMVPQINELKKLTDTFVYSNDPIQGNFYFMVANGGTHWWGYINQYIYNLLPDLFQDNTPVEPVEPVSAFNKIEAEDYTSQYGVEIEDNTSDTGKNIGYIQDGDYTVYNVDFGDGATGFQASAASESNGGNIEIRLDSLTGTLVGTCAVASTGGWNTFTDVSCDISNVTGKHDVYLKFTGESDYLMNLDWFKFNKSATPVGKIGDINSDGSIDSLDLMLIKKHLLGAGEIENTALADLDGNGTVDALDFAVMKKYLLGIISSFPE